MEVDIIHDERLFLIKQKSANRKIILKAAQINAWINYGMPAGFRTFDYIDSDGMLDMVQGLNPVSAKPKADEISAWSEKYFAQKETGTSLLAGVQADELSLLPAVSIDHAITVHVIENDRKVVVGKTVRALQFYVYSQIATWVRNLHLLSVLAQRRYGD